MSTQLRLVETLPPPVNAGDKPRKGSGQPRKVSRTVGSARRSVPSRQVHWGDWRLDDRTRTVGRAGVAAARRALREAAAEQLSEAPRSAAPLSQAPLSQAS